ncbi:hypothetical protein COV13_00870 [Candidatus Woesearchaeota archaeon CG10_big_fil_rev_8_21_14_0_10_32_9]|nr:MAG: hypothetical protein COV13_00870 [Candidatus Woesearchaeota archaeon CG10_big_fil_rev_8_21_14_0_10_32_9]
MKTAFNFIEKRSLFEKTIKQINIDSVGLELIIYDLITKTREEYSADLRTDISYISNYVKTALLDEAINLSNRYALDELINLNKIDQITQEDLINAMSIGKIKALEYMKKLDESYETEAMFLNAILKHGHAPAYIFVFGYDSSNETHRAHSFGGLWQPNEKYEFSKAINNNIKDTYTKKLIRASSKEDNAILISNSGEVDSMLVQLVDVNPERIKEKYANTEYPDNMGLDAGGHSRHHSAIGYSFHVPETTVITLGEAGYLRMFKKGHLAFSSVNQEQAKIEQRWDFIISELNK